MGSDSAETRAAIRRAAREVINERGYEAATFQAIALRAGFSRPTMHYYFHTKEEIYENLQQEAYSIVSDCIAAAQREDGLLKQLTTFVVAARRADLSDGSLMRFIVTSRFEQHRCPSLRGSATPVSEAVAEFYARIVEEAIATGELPADADAPAVVNMLYAMFWGVGFFAGFVHSADDLADIAKQLNRMFRKGLLNSSGRVQRPAVGPSVVDASVALVADPLRYGQASDSSRHFRAIAFGA
ncbi:TetR/AcrR family transcriptional regulator [Mycobacterium sp. B14F4]|uniref:TetR/AcrR family transcriptional regulator n=1 Tax=Mycobacterium sp. B14F4 TaxID=3153565 RepID=UPI00325CFA09